MQQVIEQARKRMKRRYGVRHGWTWASGVALLAVVAPAAVADPILTTHATPMAGGLVAYDVAVDFQDGLGRSGFVDVTFSGSFDAQSQLFGTNWPDLADTSSSSTTVHLRGGTGGASGVDVVAVARLVVPRGQSFQYDAVVSRNGRNFTVAPEPSAPALGLAALLGVATLRRPRRERPR